MGCTQVNDNELVSDMKHKQIKSSMTLIKEERERYSYVEVYQQESKVVIYVNSDGLLDDANFFEVETTGKISTESIEVDWQNSDKKESSTDEDTVFVRVRIKEGGQYIFDETVSLYDGAMRKIGETNNK